MRQTLFFTLSAVVACSCMSKSPLADESAVEVELKLSSEEFDPVAQEGTLTCIVYNKSDHKVSIPNGFNSDQTRVYGQGVSNELGNLATRWPLKLYRRDGGTSSTESVTLNAREQMQIFELRLSEILEARRDQPFNSDENPSASTKATADDPEQKPSWGWDWIARPRPPQSPIHSRDGLLAAAEFWVELTIEEENVVSKRQRLRIKQAVTKEKVIWETRGGGQVEFTIAPDVNGYVFHVTSHDFSQKDLSFRLTAEDEKPFKLVKKMLSNRDVPNSPPNPGNVRGTWTTITLVNAKGESKVIEHAKPWHDDLNPISRFVDDSIQKAEEKQ